MKDKLIAIFLMLAMAGCAGNKAELGVDNDRLKPCPDSPNCVNSQAPDADHFVEPIRIALPHSEIKDILLRALDDLGVSRIVVVQDDYIHAEFVSRVFRFTDDVEFNFPFSTADVVLIQVRSASRVGYSDLGVNRKRVEAIRNRVLALSQD